MFQKTQFSCNEYNKYVYKVINTQSNNNFWQLKWTIGKKKKKQKSKRRKPQILPVKLLSCFTIVFRPIFCFFFFFLATTLYCIVDMLFNITAISLPKTVNVFRAVAKKKWKKKKQSSNFGLSNCNDKHWQLASPKYRPNVWPVKIWQKNLADFNSERLFSLTIFQLPFSLIINHSSQNQ